MKKLTLLKGLVIFFALNVAHSAYAQLPDGFDIKKAYADAKAKGIQSKFLDEYVKHEHTLYLKSKGIPEHNHNANAKPVDLGTVYKSYNNTGAIFKSNGINSPQNAYCPNAGFEQFGFANWTGSTGDVTTGAVGAQFPVYTQTAAAIANSAGNNVSINNQDNFHTIMTTPATNSVYPNCVGYDSVAVRVVGTQSVSEIPVVNPNGGPASVRMNGIKFSNDVGCKLTYNMTLNPNNKSFSVSYALVLNNGGHMPYEQPYFSVKVRDQNGNLVPGCSQYTVTIDNQVTTPGSPSYDPLWQQSVIAFDTYYRPWSTYAFDFSNYPAITSVSVEFYVGGCSLGGHFGYAYVDAECSQGGAVSSFCAGSTSAVLNAPVGFNTYQWVGPSGPVSVANGGNTPTATITPVSAGQVFTCNVTSLNGCSSSFQTTVAITTVSITGVGSTPSCPNGNSGSANVNATGSSSGYSYQWLNSSGTTVGTAQTATGLSPGTYSVIVSSPGCGSNTGTVSVGNAPPFFYSLAAPFCGTTAWITNNGGSNYLWYNAGGTQIAGATTPTLTISSPVDGTNYFLGFTTATGCRDSIKYTLNQIPGGNIYVSNIKSICPGNSNATAVVNLQTTASPAAYSYSVTGPGGYNSTVTNTSTITYSVSNMAIGTYTADVFDGQCLYNTTFTVAPFIYTYTLTPQTTTICTGNNATLTANFGNTTPSACGLSTSGSCTSPSIIQIGTGTTENTSTSYPAIYSNWYKNARHQILYRASELLAAGIQPGKISSMAFNVTNFNSGTTTYPDFTIKLKCTSVADLSSTTFDNTGLTQVYYAASQNITTGWNTYSFPTAYEWDGVSNLLIDICTSQTANYTYNSSSPYSITPYVSVRWFNSDGTVACMTSNTASSYSPNNTYRPNIKFANCGGFNPAAFSYTWTPSASLNPTNSYTTIASPSVTTVYTLNVEPIGQTNCVQTQTSTVNVTIPVTPSIAATSTLCSNAPAFSLTATPAGGTWSVTAPTSSVGVFTPSLAAVGNNTVTYTYGAVGCLQTTTSIVPIVKYVPSTITGTVAPLCITNPAVNLSTALSTSTLGPGTWSGNGVAGTTFDPSMAGAGVHQIVYTTNSNPVTSLCTSTTGINISVSTVTQPTITPAPPYCDNFASQTMSATPTGGIWTAGTIGTSLTPVGEFFPASSVVGGNKVLYTLTNGPCVKKDSIIVNITHFIQAGILGSYGPYCVYDPTVALVPTIAGGVWTGNGVTGSMFTPSIATPGTHTIQYKTDPAPAGLCPDSAQMSVLVNPKPNAVPIINGPIDGCNPLTVNYQVSTVTGGSTDWDFGDGESGTGLTTIHTYTTPGTYTAIVTYTDNVGCIDTSASVQAVTVYSVPVAAFEANPDVTTVVDGEVHFNNQSTGATNSYQWDFEGDGIFNSSETSPINLYVNSGEFFVTLIVVNEHFCSDTAIKKVTINPDVVMYVPNAFTPDGDGLNDEFQIFLPPSGVDYNTFNLTIYDRWGSVIYRAVDYTKYWNGAENNSGPIMKEGVYVWKITFMDDQKKYYEKLGHVSLLK